jgi:glyoxylase-like metal-dependent hydrolase (beta-lactamase superfamily II)
VFEKRRKNQKRQRDKKSGSGNVRDVENRIGIGNAMDAVHDAFRTGSKLQRQKGKKMASLKIHPLHLGSITREKFLFTYWFKPGTIIDAPVIAWYIEGADKRILIDTGGGDPQSVADQRFKPYNREEQQSIENALKNIGVGCEDIDIVIASHLHWDHCAGTRLFKDSEIIVQEGELRAARAPFPVQHGYVKSLFEGIDYTVISGDVEIADGVTAILTPGHTYGLQGVLVEAYTQKYFIASDTVGLFSNLESEPPMIGGIYVDLKLYYESLEKIGKLQATILPGHDIRVFKRKVYS